MHLVPPKKSVNRHHCDMGDGYSGDCPIFLGKTNYCRFQKHIVKEPVEPSCRYFWHGTGMCYMGPMRTSGCHIFQGKAKTCDFQWPQEEEVQKKDREKWIVIEPKGNTSKSGEEEILIFEKEAEIIEYLKDVYDLRGKHNPLIEDVVVFHVSTIEKYKVKVVDPIKLVPKGG